MMTEYNLRKADGNDLAFIYATWLNSYRLDSDTGKSCRKSIFFEEYREVLDHILEKSDVLIACHKDHPNVIFGYSVTQDSIIHYVFVKESFQRLGIGSRLTKGDFNFHTHKTNALEKLSVKTTYNPFLLYAKGETNVSSKEVS